MAEGGPIYQESVNEETENLETIVETEETSQLEAELPAGLTQPLPPPTPTPMQSLLPVTSQSVFPWGGPNSVGLTFPEITHSQGLQLPPIPGHLGAPRRFPAPTKWQEAYNLYVLHEDTNQKARHAYQTGCISFKAAQRIYLSGLQDVRKLTNQGKLHACYLGYMLDYGKYYNYIDRSISQ